MLHVNDRRVRVWKVWRECPGRRLAKKEEFPGLMENMLPGNSFPQICVVSVNESVEKI
jgi:hypothetical protein